MPTNKWARRTPPGQQNTKPAQERITFGQYQRANWKSEQAPGPQCHSTSMTELPQQPPSSCPRVWLRRPRGAAPETVDVIKKQSRDHCECLEKHVGVWSAMFEETETERCTHTHTDFAKSHSDTTTTLEREHRETHIAGALPLS